MPLSCACVRTGGVQADITALPFQSSQFDVVYCEGVIQHTRDSPGTVRELVRVTREGGRILATHYVRTPPTTLAHKARRRLTSAYYEFLRRRLGGLDRYALLLATGNLPHSATCHFSDACWTRTGTALRYELMPDSRPVDEHIRYYGQHSFQRFATPEEFFRYFEALGNVDLTSAARVSSWPRSGVHETGANQCAVSARSSALRPMGP